MRYLFYIINFYYVIFRVKCSYHPTSLLIICLITLVKFKLLLALYEGHSISHHNFFLLKIWQRGKSSTYVPKNVVGACKCYREVGYVHSGTRVFHAQTSFCWNFGWKCKSVKCHHPTR
jgi:hypothetical protein